MHVGRNKRSALRRTAMKAGDADAVTHCQIRALPFRPGSMPAVVAVMLNYRCIFVRDGAVQCATLIAPYGTNPPYVLFPK